MDLGVACYSRAETLQRQLPQWYSYTLAHMQVLGKSIVPL